MNILLACDQESFNDAIAEFVIKYPWPANSIFHIVNVIPSIYDYAYASAVPDLMMQLREDAKSEASIRVRKMALKLRDHFHTDNVKESILQGNPAEMLLETAESWPADLVILGSHARTGLNRLLMGSVSSAVLEHAPCSAIIIREHKSKENDSFKSEPKVEAIVI